MYKSLHFSALCAFLHLIPSIQADSSTFPGKVDESNYVWYDATEECKNTTLPCFTNFKYCSRSDETDDDVKCPESVRFAKGFDGFGQWLEYENKPLAYLDVLETFTLRWTNTNPKYSTYISWHAGPSDNKFSMYNVLPPGKTEWELSLDFLTDKMLPSYFVPANESRQGSTGGIADGSELTGQLFNSAAGAWPAFFTIGQPDDPKYGESHDQNLQGKQVNATDSTSRFSTSDFGYAILDEQQRFRDYTEYQSEQIGKKWKLGVGVGVGLGFPLFMALAFFLGRKSASKSKHTKQGEAKDWDNRGLCKP